MGLFLLIGGAAASPEPGLEGRAGIWGLGRSGITGAFFSSVEPSNGFTTFAGRGGTLGRDGIPGALALSGLVSSVSEGSIVVISWWLSGASSQMSRLGNRCFTVSGLAWRPWVPWPCNIWEATLCESIWSAWRLRCASASGVSNLGLDWSSGKSGVDTLACNWRLSGVSSQISWLGKRCFKSSVRFWKRSAADKGLPDFSSSGNSGSYSSTSSKGVCTSSCSSPRELQRVRPAGAPCRLVGRLFGALGVRLRTRSRSW